MALTTDHSFFLQRLYWMVRLRWITAILVALGVLLHELLGIPVQDAALYILIVWLFVYNLTIFLLLKHHATRGESLVSKILTRSINYQISLDMLFLTFLVHYSGGVESPFVFLFILLMIIASFFLSIGKNSLKATAAVLLFGLMILLEYSGVIPHYCPKEDVLYCAYRESNDVLGFLLLFTVTIYLIAFITASLTAHVKQIDSSHKQDPAKPTAQNRMIDQYFAGLTHDVKGHLAAIQSCLGIVLKGALDEQSTEFANRAYERTKKLASHMNIFMKLTNMKFNHKILISRFPLSRTVDDVVNTLKPEAEEKSVKLNYDASDNDHVIYGIKSSIETMIASVLQNMMALTPNNSTISVSLTNHARLVQLKISDTGVDLPTADLSKVFNEFYWVSQAKNTEIEGIASEWLGIKHVVEDHGGEIRVIRQNEQGVHLIITLPCFSEKPHT